MPDGTRIIEGLKDAVRLARSGGTIQASLDTLHATARELWTDARLASAPALDAQQRRQLQLILSYLGTVNAMGEEE